VASWIITFKPIAQLISMLLVSQEVFKQTTVVGSFLPPTQSSGGYVSTATLSAAIKFDLDHRFQVVRVVVVSNGCAVYPGGIRFTAQLTMR
jgi:hypothetical protein